MTDRRAVPPLHAELHALGELPPAQQTEVETRLAAGPDPLAGLPSDAQTFADDPPDAVAREVRRRVAEAAWADRRRRSRMLFGSAAFAAATMAVVALLPPAPCDPTDPQCDIVLKGEATTVIVYRQAPEGAERLGPDDIAASGDRLQLAFRAPGMTHGVLYSVDGAGVLTEHHRFAGTPLTDGVVLPTAYRLDAAPGFETFHLIAAPASFDVDALLRRAEGSPTTAPRPPTGGVTATFHLRKDSR